VQLAEIARRGLRGNPLQDTVRHFQQRNLEPELASRGRGFEPDIAAADDQ